MIWRKGRAPDSEYPRSIVLELCLDYTNLVVCRNLEHLAMDQLVEMAYRKRMVTFVTFFSELFFRFFHNYQDVVQLCSYFVKFMT